MRPGTPTTVQLDGTSLNTTEPAPMRTLSPISIFPKTFAPAPDNIQPLENFCLLLLEPVQVDHLELRGEPQNRWVYYRNENQEWLTEAINP